MKITVIFTCFNRKEKTTTAMQSLVEKNPSLDFKFVIVDDKSTDGTVDAINSLHYDTNVIMGTGNLYWCGGMRKGIEKYLMIDDGTDCLLINDDVIFFDCAIEKMVEQNNNRKDTVIVGATQDAKGKITYGLQRLDARKSFYFDIIDPNPNKEENGDTMNANCVLIPYFVMKKIGNMDATYRHSLGDYDYGFAIKRAGFNLVSSKFYVGICDNNTNQNTWRDRNLGRVQRLKLKENVKGSPFKEWWHFLYKNAGLIPAIRYSITPYLRILVGR